MFLHVFAFALPSPSLERGVAVVVDGALQCAPDEGGELHNTKRRKANNQLTSQTECMARAASEASFKSNWKIVKRFVFG